MFFLQTINFPEQVDWQIYKGGYCSPISTPWWHPCTKKANINEWGNFGFGCHEVNTMHVDFYSNMLMSQWSRYPGCCLILSSVVWSQLQTLPLPFSVLNTCLDNNTCMSPSSRNVFKSPLILKMQISSVFWLITSFLCKISLKRSCTTLQHIPLQLNLNKSIDLCLTNTTLC